MNWFKIAKHVSDHSHFCGLCKTDLKPRSFAKNNRHHYPWGITYACDCGKSSLWTNSIRDGAEFMNIVFGDNSARMGSGFCNDLFCGECLANATYLKNGLNADSQKNFLVYVPAEERSMGRYHPVNDLESFMKHYVKNGIDMSDLGPPIENKDVELTYGYDVVGCRTVNHNVTIISTGSGNEYGEGEYEPIYDWIISNKHLVPQGMIKEFQEYVNR
jgi:hypothetical protein